MDRNASQSSKWMNEVLWRPRESRRTTQRNWRALALSPPSLGCSGVWGAPVKEPYVNQYCVFLNNSKCV